MLLLNIGGYSLKQVWL